MTDLLVLCANLPRRAVPAGETLIDEGAAPGPMYVLVSGSVTVGRDGETFARIDLPGAVFGEMSVVLGQPATATVRAETDLEAYVVEEPEDFLREHPGAALAVLRMTAARLDGMTRYLVDVRSQFAELEGHLGMVEGVLDTLVHHQAAPAQAGSARDPEVGHQH